MRHLFALAALIVAATTSCHRGPPPDSREAAARTYARNCMPCHGPTGDGDGPSGKGLSPPPRSFHDLQWQRATTDEQIEIVIAKGGAALGKSVAMPPNPDLAGDPAALAAMRDYVRSFAQGR